MLPASRHSLRRIQPRWSIHKTLHLTFRPSAATLERYPPLPVPLSNSSEYNAPKNGRNVHDSSVFEDHTDDYNSVARDTPTRRPSTLSLIEAKLPPQLPAPTPNDAFIFEDSSDFEYRALSIPQNYNPNSLIESFQALVSTKRFDEAYNLMLEIQGSGIEIPPSHIWEIPAQAALMNPSLEHSSKEARTSRFITWFQLIPARHMADIERRFRRSRRLVFHTLHSNIPLAIQFSIVMASKGYATIVSQDAIPFIMRHAPPAVSLRFIKDFEKAAINYLSKSTVTVTTIRHLRANVRGLAIESLAQANYIDEALSLLPGPGRPTFQLSDGTYGLLLFRLRRSHVPGSSVYESHVKELRLHPSYSLRSGKKLGKRPRIAFLGGLDMDIMKTMEQQIATEEAHPKSDKYIGDSLAAELNVLIEAVQSSSSFPSIIRLATFIRDYLNTGRTSAIVRLRGLSLGAGVICGTRFLQAEMSYYLMQDLPILVLKTFTKHFYISGVPNEEIFDKLRNFAESLAHGDAGHDHPAYAATRSKSTHQLWPHHFHINIVWQALIKLTPSDEGVEKLYRRFLQLSSLNADKNSTDTSFLRSPLQRNAIVGSSIFTPFIRRLLSTKRPELCPEFVQDMMKLNIIPTIHQFTLIAGFYASIGDAQRVFKVMDALERPHPVEKPEAMVNQQLDGWKRSKEIPRPDVIFYTSLLRGFIKSRQPSDALEVIKRFNRRYIYVHGQHSPLDEAYAGLERLLSKKSNRNVMWQRPTSELS